MRIGSPYHSYNDNDAEEQFQSWNHFKKIFSIDRSYPALKSWKLVTIKMYYKV